MSFILQSKTKKNLTQSNHQIVTLLFGVGIICLCHNQTLKRVKEYNTELPFEKWDTYSNNFSFFSFFFFKNWDLQHTVISECLESLYTRTEVKLVHIYWTVLCTHEYKNVCLLFALKNIKRFDSFIIIWF